MPERLRIGVSGVGSIGSRHARLLAQLGVCEVFLYDREPPALELPAGTPSPGWSASFEGLLDLGLDGIIIAVPDEHHGEQVEAACVHRIPVLVEKPLASASAVGRHLEQVAAETGTPLLVGYVLRYNQAMLRTERLLAETIGTPLSVQVSLGARETLLLARRRFATRAPYRIVLDYSHEWDYLEWLLGPVHRVAAATASIPGRAAPEEPDLLETLLEFDGGQVGTVHLDYVRQAGGRCCSFVGEQGSLRVDVGSGCVELRSEDGRVTRFEGGEPRDAMFTRQLQHFIAVVRREEAPLVSASAGRRAVEVAEAVRAAAERGEWVELPSSFSAPSSRRRPSG